MLNQSGNSKHNHRNVDVECIHKKLAPTSELIKAKYKRKHKDMGIIAIESYSESSTGPQVQKRF